MAATCPCGLGLPYDECCGRYHRGEAIPPTAEALMRSRYSAYARRDAAYLRRTWHRTGRPAAVAFEDDLRWTRLEIIGTTGGSLFESSGTVEFAAHYRAGGRADVMRENSRFVREDGIWLYTGPV